MPFDQLRDKRVIQVPKRFELMTFIEFTFISERYPLGYISPPPVLIDYNFKMESHTSLNIWNQWKTLIRITLLPLTDDLNYTDYLFILVGKIY